MTDTEILDTLANYYKDKIEEAKGDHTLDPVDAETFFDEEEAKAENYDQMICYLVNYIAHTRFGTLTLENNPFIGARF